MSELETLSIAKVHMLRVVQLAMTISIYCHFFCKETFQIRCDLPNFSPFPNLRPNKKTIYSSSA